MQILEVSQIRAADRHTIRHEPIASVDLMERASQAFAEWLVRRFGPEHPIQVYCGIGNNGGDGLAIARLLHHRGYDVRVCIVRLSDKGSPDFETNLTRLRQHKGVPITDLKGAKGMPRITRRSVLIDAIFGSGLNRPVKGFAADILEKLNRSRATRVAVDIPSGLYADKHSPSVKFAADYTVSFELPKRTFFYPDNTAAVGRWTAVPIGLDRDFITQQATAHHYLTREEARAWLRSRPKHGHKGTFGHSLLLCGSRGMMGAAALATHAALRSGSGLVTAHVPKCGYDILQSTVPEALTSCDKHAEYLTGLPPLKPYQSIGVGCGIGTARATAKMLRQLLKEAPGPLVLDADALNILAKTPGWLKEIPKNSILTPHPGEFRRLAGKFKHDVARHARQVELAKEYGVYIVRKGAHTAIACPDGATWFNTTGNPGMATGGSGDVLTGMLTGLLAQGYPPREAAVLGVYLHGLAGDRAACKHSPQAMTARDMVGYIGRAYLGVVDKE